MLVPYPPAASAVSLQIEQDEIFGLLGDNGAGKSTLVRQMVNLLRGSARRIALFGRDIAADPLLVPMNVDYMPPERLPPLMIALGRFSPATYAASALRQALLGPVTPRIAIDLGILSVLAVLILWLVGRTMDWRQR